MDISDYRVRPTKHFTLDYMRKWDYDIEQLRKAIETAYRTEKTGKNKYEAYVRAKTGSRKIIYAKDEEYKEIIVISGAEGK